MAGLPGIRLMKAVDLKDLKKKKTFEKTLTC